MDKPTYILTVGRLGMYLQVSVLNEEAIPTMEYHTDVNGAGLCIKRLMNPLMGDAVEILVCDRESFLYPDRVQDEEIDLVRMLMGSFIPGDEVMIRMCSFLCAQWQAGHSEEQFHDTIKSSLEKLIY